MHFVFDGISIAYEQHGNGRPIVFLHNLGAHRRIWEQQLAALAVDHCVYALDWPGYGESEIPDDGYTIDRHQQLLDAFLAHNSLDEVTLVGNCFGSAMSLEYARRHPDKVVALVLISPLTAGTLRSTRTGRAARFFRPFPLARVVRHIRIPKMVARLVVREQLAGNPPASAWAAVDAVTDAWTDKGRLVATVGTLADLPKLAVLDEFQPSRDFPPITVIWGERNRVLDPTVGMQLAEHWGARKSVSVPAGGHLVMLEQAELVTTAIMDALEESAELGAAVEPRPQ